MTPGRTAMLVGIAVFVWLTLRLLLVIFAGILLAVLLRPLARLLAERTGLATTRALAVVLLAIVGVIGLAGWLYAPRLAEQFDQLTKSLPSAFGGLTVWMEQYAWGRWLMEQATSGADGRAVENATRVFSGVTNLTVAVAVILFTGLYLAAEPGPYIRGALRLLPLHRRERAAEAMFASGEALRWWLFGQLTAMVLVGLTMGIGLAIIGVPLALLLGVLAGVFEFVPVVGPIVALGPALLLALAESPNMAAWVLLLYGIVQTAESYVVTPLVQRRAIELPPVVTIVTQVALSWAAGAIGLLVAVPLVAVIMATVQLLYIRDTLGDRMESEWEPAGREAVDAERDGLLKGVLPRGQPA